VESGSGQAEERRLTGLPLLAVGLGVVLFIQAAFVLSYVGALHDPKPHHVRFGVVGTSPLTAAVGKAFSLRIRRFATEAAARSAIEHREIDGALVAGAAKSRLLVVPAAGAAGAVALTNTFSVAATALRQPIEPVVLHSLPPGDANGTVSFFAVMALVLGGYLSSTIATVFTGTATRRGRLAALALVAAAGALLTDVFVGPVLDALPTSKFFVLWGLFAFVMLAVAYATSALQTVLGAAGTIVVVVLFVVFGAPASGGSLPSPYLPTFWRTFGPYFPAGAGTTAVRNTVYFDGNGIARALLVLAAYLVVGAAVMVTARRRRARIADAEAEASAAATVVV
jgi:hypothetical protein